MDSVLEKGVLVRHLRCRLRFIRLFIEKIRINEKQDELMNRRAYFNHIVM